MANMNTHSAQGNDDLAENMKTVVATLMKLRGLRVPDMLRLLHITSGTWYNRMHDGNWTAHQLVGLSSVLEVEIGDLFASPDQLVRSRCFSSLTLVEGGDEPTDPGGSARPILRVA